MSDRTMVEFDQLPPTSRSLILATLALDIASINCRNIFELALRRHQTVQEVWRDVCRRTAQPRCTMPPSLLESRYTATAARPTKAATAAPAAASNAVPAAPPTASPAAPLPGSVTATNVICLGDLIAVTTAAPAAEDSPTPAASGQRARRRSVMLAAGVAAMLLLAIGFVVLASISRPTSPSTARPDETVRVGGARPDQVVRTSGAPSGIDAASVPAPQGTVRRMDAISKSFSKP